MNGAEHQLDPGFTYMPGHLGHPHNGSFQSPTHASKPMVTGLLPTLPPGSGIIFPPTTDNYKSNLQNCLYHLAFSSV